MYVLVLLSRIDMFEMEDKSEGLKGCEAFGPRRFVPAVSLNPALEKKD